LRQSDSTAILFDIKALAETIDRLDGGTPLIFFDTTSQVVAKYVIPAFATLIPAGITASVKTLLDNSRKRRSVALTERISTLAKSISELPQVALSNPTPAVTPQSALTAELEAALRELTVLQTRVRHNLYGVSTSITTKVRGALLLYKPKGWAATLLHAAFYGYMFVFFFVLYAGLSPDTTSNVSHAKDTGDFVANLFGFLTVFGLAGIPPLVLRHFAAQIHRRQNLQAQAAARVEASQVAAVPIPARGN
jgi:hypothetical protein